jgi:hypothetical protein
MPRTARFAKDDQQFGLLAVFVLRSNPSDYAALNPAYLHQGTAAYQSHGCLLRTTDPIHLNPSLMRRWHRRQACLRTQ